MPAIITFHISNWNFIQFAPFSRRVSANRLSHKFTRRRNVKRAIVAIAIQSATKVMRNQMVATNRQKAADHRPLAGSSITPRRTYVRTSESYCVIIVVIVIIICWSLITVPLSCSRGCNAPLPAVRMSKCKIMLISYLQLLLSILLCCGQCRHQIPL